MDIRFCDICNESVPASDLAVGRAFERKGRVICASCDLAMSPRPGDAVGAPQAPVGTAAATDRAGVVLAAPAARTDGIALALAAVALVGVGAVAYLARIEVDRVADEAAAERTWLAEGWRGERRAIEDSARVAAEGASAEWARRDDEWLARERAATAERAALVERLAAIEHSMQQLVADVEQRNAAAGGEGGAEARLAELESGLEQARADLGVLTRTLLDTLDRPMSGAGVAASGGFAGERFAAGGERATHDDVAAGPDPFADVLPRLASDDPRARWAAVEELGQRGDAAAAMHVVPMLEDSDLFVRMAAARVLGELSSGDAVPALIDTLEDGDPAVREAAVLALRTITGRSFAFDPNGSVSERGRQVAAWREWWRRNGGAPGTGE